MVHSDCIDATLRGGVVQSTDSRPLVTPRRRLQSGLWLPRYNRFFSNVISLGERWCVCNVGARGIVIFDFWGEGEEGRRDDKWKDLDESLEVDEVEIEEAD